MLMQCQCTTRTGSSIGKGILLAALGQIRKLSHSTWVYRKAYRIDTLLSCWQGYAAALARTIATESTGHGVQADS